MMPSTYAHRLFGERVRKRVSDPAGEIIDKNRELYDIGLHGPDILFFHRPFHYDKVNKLGHKMHKEKGSRFFGDVIPIVRESDDEEAYLAYILGFICHFALDSTCHPYVNDAVADLEVAHVAMETEFDKMLMRRAALDPWTYDVTGHMKPSASRGRVIGDLLGIKPADAERAVLDMKKYCRFFVTENKLARGTILPTAKFLGLGDIRGMFVNRKDDPRCKESNDRLLQLFEQAVPAGIALVDNYIEVYNGAGSMSDRFEERYE